MNPFPTFLGIKLDPKLSYKQHLIHLSEQILKNVTHQKNHQLTAQKLQGSKPDHLQFTSQVPYRLRLHSNSLTISENSNQHPESANQSLQMHQALSPENIHQRHPRLPQN